MSFGWRQRYRSRAPSATVTLPVALGGVMCFSEAARAFLDCQNVVYGDYATGLGWVALSRWRLVMGGSGTGALPGRWC